MKVRCGLLLAIELNLVNDLLYLLQVELQSSEDVKKLNPKLERMIDFPGRGGVIVTAPADASSEYDFISRFFCPKMGINEVLSLFLFEDQILNALFTIIL